MFPRLKLLKFIVWQMISAKNFRSIKKNTCSPLHQRTGSTATSPTVWVMLKSCSSWFFSIQEVTDVSNTFIRNMSANIWVTCFHEGHHTIALLSWKKKSCFLWPYSSRRYCWEHVQELALWIQHHCGYVETKESIFTRHLKVWLGVENVQWDGSSDSNYIW